MPNYAKEKRKLKDSYNHFHNTGHEAFREVKQKSYYPFGRKKGAGLLPTDEFRDGWDRIFGKPEEPADFDSKA